MAKRLLRRLHTRQLHLGSRLHLPTIAPRLPASVRPRQPLARRLLATAPPALRSVAAGTYPPRLPHHPSTLLRPLVGILRAPSHTRRPLLISLDHRRRLLPLATAQPHRLTAQRLRVSEVWTDTACSIGARAVPLYHQPIQINHKKNRLANEIAGKNSHFSFFTIWGLLTLSPVSVFLATFEAIRLSIISSFFFLFLPLEDALVPAVSPFFFFLETVNGFCPPSRGWSWMDTHEGSGRALGWMLS